MDIHYFTSICCVFQWQRPKSEHLGTPLRNMQSMVPRIVHWISVREIDSVRNQLHFRLQELLTDWTGKFSEESSQYVVVVVVASTEILNLNFRLLFVNSNLADVHNGHSQFATDCCKRRKV